MQRVALITGGARGIGKAIGLALAERGWSISFCFRTSSAAAGDTLAALQERGAKPLSLQADVGQPEQAQQLVEKVLADRGRIDALVHCAGPYHRVPLFEETPEGWNEMFDSNLHSLFYCARAVAPGMKARGWGRILAFSMANADRLTSQPNVTAHYIAKAGVLVLVRTLAKVLAPHRITVNTISPGFIDSGSAPASELEGMLKKIPAKRIGKLDDVVSAALYLMSEEADYVNGANLHLSGAWGV